MKKLKTALLIILSILMIITVPSCSCSGDDTSEESSIPEEASIAAESSEEAQPSKEESSKKEEKSKPEESSEEEPNYLEPDVDSSREILSDFSYYYSQNSDTVGWVNVPYTAINYVVTQSPGDIVRTAYGEDPYYLSKDFYGNYYYSGTIFMDYRSKIGAKNMILHGHSMANGTMFAGIISYSSLDFYKSAPVISFNTLYDKAKWKIIAVIKVNTDESQGPVFNYLRSSFSSNYDFLNFVYELRMRSVIDCPVDVNENDTLVTLSTCAYDFNGFRQAIIARKVREGEDSKVAVSKAKYNPNPLYPDVWYAYRGGTKPTVTSFQDALNKKQIKWYDGTKKWSSKDDEKLKTELQKMKDTAEKKIRDSFNQNDYTEAQMKEINDIINIYLDAVKKGTDASKVNNYIKQCSAIIATFEPQKKLAEEERKKKEKEEKARQDALKKARSEAVTAIKNAVKGKTYRKAQQEKVDKLIKEYTQKINSSEDLEMISVMKQNAVSMLGKIQTDAQLKEKENKKT